MFKVAGLKFGILYVAAIGVFVVGSLSSCATDRIVTNTTGPSLMYFRIPVVVCNTIRPFGVLASRSLPKYVTFELPRTEENLFSIYTDDVGLSAILAPKGWYCTGQISEDGSGGIEVSPQRMPFSKAKGQTLPVAGGKVITLSESGGSTVQGAASACNLFPEARSATERWLGQCPPN